MKKEHLFKLLKSQTDFSRLLSSFERSGFDLLNDRYDILKVVVDMLGYDEQKHNLDGIMVDFQTDVLDQSIEDTDKNINLYLNWLINYLHGTKPS